jgi:hypothetical protein
VESRQRPVESVDRAVSSLVGFRLRLKDSREGDDTDSMSNGLNDSLAITLSALLVEVLADNADDPRLLPPCVLLEAHPVC